MRREGGYEEVESSQSRIYPSLIPEPYLYHKKGSREKEYCDGDAAVCEGSCHEFNDRRYDAEQSDDAGAQECHCILFHVCLPPYSLYDPILKYRD